MIIPVAAFLGPVIGSYSRVLIHPFSLRPTAEALTVEMVGWETWNA